MKFSLTTLLAAAALSFTLLSAQAQTLTYSWSATGGGLSPATYGGSYQPSTLVPDGSATGASISVAGYAGTGGLGSGSAPSGYGYFYSLFNENITLSINVTNVLDNVGTVSLTFWSGGTTPWSDEFLTLNFNASNTAVVASGYSTTPGEDSEFGPVTYYTWVWDVSELGVSTGFSVNTFTLGQHTPMGDIQLTQTAVPEPSVFALFALGLGVLWFLRSRRNRQCA